MYNRRRFGSSTKEDMFLEFWAKLKIKNFKTKLKTLKILKII